MKKSPRTPKADRPVARSFLAKPVREIPDGNLAALRRKARDCPPDDKCAAMFRQLVEDLSEITKRTGVSHE